MEQARPLVALADEPLTAPLADKLRRASAIVCTDKVMCEQIKREMKVIPFSSVNEAKEWVLENPSNGRVAVIIPNYNYSRFVQNALDAVLNQTKQPDELIVVDDKSTDDSMDVIDKWMHQDAIKARVIQHDVNTGNVGGPRNTGILNTDAEFIITLDSDDLLEPTYIETLYNAIVKDKSLGVVYSGVQVLSNDSRRVVPNWPIPFNWEWMMQADRQPRTCIPTASMYRRDMWLRAGGYDSNRVSAEDVDFWSRALPNGFNAAKVTDDPLFVYRQHGHSMSNRPIVDISMWSPIYNNGTMPMCAPSGVPPKVIDYTKPLVSVVIPVGPKHVDKIVTALHSLLAQTMKLWQVIIVNASGKTLPLKPYPFATVVNVPVNTPAGIARNTGVEYATAPLLFFLDADDFIVKDALELMLKRYAKGDAGYVYSGWWWVRDNGKTFESAIPAEYNQADWLKYDAAGFHSVSVLIATQDFKALGGFDTRIDIYEDLFFFAKCASNGLCGAPVKSELLCYRVDTGDRRTDAASRRSAYVDFLKTNAKEIIEGKSMGCCGGNAAAVAAISADSKAAFDKRAVGEANLEGSKFMQLNTPRIGEVTYLGKYIGCKDCPPIWVPNGDWQILEANGWTEVKTQPYTPKPAVVTEDNE